ncbi:MAG: PEGA domain-containing protein [Terriglobia bacterium]|jgi:hypothetical protein
MRFRQAVVAWGLVLACAGSTGQAQAAHLADGTAVHVRLTADLMSSRAVVGTRVELEIAEPVTLQGVVVIPAGAMAWGAVQMVKSGKILHFDIEGVRLPNQEIVKLRCSPQRTNRAAKDELKVETQVGGDLGAPKGSGFTAYLDQDVNVNAAGAPAAPAQATPVVAPAAAPQPAAPPAAPEVAPVPAAVVPPTPVPETSPAKPTPVAAAPAVSAPAAPTAQPGEYITVECFSDPTGADIMIDDEFHGSTPSILKLLPGNYRIEFRLMGYKAHSQPLNLTPGTGLRTVRMDLEKQP